MAAGTVEAGGVALHDGTQAGTGDQIVTRHNDRRLTSDDGRWVVKNGDRWQVTGRFEDGSLAVRRLGRGSAPYGQTVVLPGGYVIEHVELGYAATVHRAQGSTVDTPHAILDPDTATRELLYVAMTRGRDANHVYLTTDEAASVEEHHDEHAQTPTARELLEQVMVRTDTAPTATETLRLAVTEHASLTQLVREYETIAAHAQHRRWEKLLEDSDLTDAQLDLIFDSPDLPRLEAALSQGEANGHDMERILNRAAPRLNEHPRPAAALSKVIEHYASQPRGGTPHRPAASRRAHPDPARRPHHRPPGGTHPARTAHHQRRAHPCNRGDPHRRTLGHAARPGTKRGCAWQPRSASTEASTT